MRHPTDGSPWWTTPLFWVQFRGREPGVSDRGRQTWPTRSMPSGTEPSGFPSPSRRPLHGVDPGHLAPRAGARWITYQHASVAATALPWHRAGCWVVLGCRRDRRPALALEWWFLSGGHAQEPGLHGALRGALAYTGLGLLLILDRMVDYRSMEWARWVVLLAAGGFMGNFVLSLADHAAQNGFFHPSEWIGVVAGAVGVGFLTAMVVVPTSRALLIMNLGLMVIQFAVGLLGSYLHARRTGTARPRRSGTRSCTAHRSRPPALRQPGDSGRVGPVGTARRLAADAGRSGLRVIGLRPRSPRVIDENTVSFCFAASSQSNSLTLNIRRIDCSRDDAERRSPSFGAS